jgi:hypothetical protein
MMRELEAQGDIENTEIAMERGDDKQAPGRTSGRNKGIFG